ncbi:TPA: hypothetical protein SMI06_000453 [Serratia marcescens]|nr:hypothetical protein [Serratia marcescens]
MSHIEQVLTQATMQEQDTDALFYIRQHSDAAYEGIISGLGAIGNLAFWACDSENYSGSDAREDLRSLGEMLMHLPGIAAALKTNAETANFNIAEREQKKKR